MTVLGRIKAAAGLEPKRYGSGGPFEASIGYSRVVSMNGLAWTAGTTSIVDGELLGAGDAGAQARIALEQAVAALERANYKRTHIVQSRLYVVDIAANGLAVGAAHAAVLGDIRPVSALIGVAALIDPGMLVEVELMAAARVSPDSV
jgi:enamine deaminase RidA (YjgF/YER057c/UK114 family)